MAEGPDNTKVQLTPKLGDLVKLKISNWSKVGEKLGIADSDLQQINKKHKDDSHACQRAMFGKWLRDHSFPCAQDVIDALRKAEERRAVEELSRKYPTTEGYTSVSLPERTATTITNLNFITSGPEIDGKCAVRKIASDVIEERVTAQTRMIRRHRALLQKKEWANFLAAVDYRLPKFIRFHNSLDMGKLPEVSEIAPILLKGPLFHFICFNLTQDMTKPVQATVDTNNHQKTHYFSWQTMKQFVSQVVETVTTFNWRMHSSEKATHRGGQTTAIIGVHSGENSQVKTELPRADADIKQVVQSCGSENAVRYCYRQDDQMIFPLDLSMSHDNTRVKEVVRQVLDSRAFSEGCSLTNSAYELIFLLYYSHLVLNYSECKYAARLCGVPENDLPGILKKVHDKLGLILYFHEVPEMKELVICDPMELITPLESFTAVVLSGTSNCPQDPNEVRKTGEIPLSLIDELVNQEEQSANKLTVACLLGLLKYYKFLSADVEQANGTVFHFMPCLLKPCSLPAQKQGTVPSLLFCFKRGHSPHSSLFTALVAQLARNWKLTNKARYKNTVEFIADDSLLTKVELNDRQDHFELAVIEADSQLPHWFSHIREVVQRALHLVKVRYVHLSSEVCHIGVYCPRSLRSHKGPHCAPVKIVAGKAHFQCTEKNCKQKGQIFDQKLELWFTGDQELCENSVNGFADLSTTTFLSSDILDEEDMSQQIQDHIVEEGAIPLRVVRCGLYGAPGVGKTSSMRRLTNKIKNLKGGPTLPSTGIEAPITVPLYNTTRQLPILITDDEQQWKCQDLDSQLQMIVQCIIKTDDDNIPTTAQHSVVTENTMASTLPNQEALVEMSTATPNAPTTSYSSPSPVSEEPAKPVSAYSAVPLKVPLSLTAPKHFNPSYIRNLIKNKKWKKMKSILEFDDVTLLNIVDTGGQPEYQDILPVLLGGSGLSLLFFNLSQELEKSYPVVYRHATEGTKSIEYRSQFTTIEMLFQVLATLTSTCTTTRDYAAILVGTHQDLVTTKDIENLEEKVIKELHETEFLKKDVIKSFEAAGKKRNIFPLDNMTGSENEIQRLQKIIGDVAKSFPYKRLPTSWLLFHLALQYENIENRLGYCTMKECEHLASRCGIQAKDVPQILLYFHRTFGTILYYPEVPCMANIVICNPSIIFALINSLVAESFNSHDSPYTAQSIRETGLIPKYVLDRIQQNDTAGEKLKTKDIIELLKHLHIIMEIQNDPESEESSLFMPCLLHHCNVESTSLEQLQAMNPAPLFIHFSCGYVPTGFFNVLIIGLQIAQKWFLEDDTKQYKNQVSFITDKTSISKCTLTLHLKYLQVDVDAGETNEVCISIRKTLLSAIDEVRKKRPYLESVKPQLRLLCQHAKNQDMKQFAICHNPESPEKMSCRNPACSKNSTHVLLPKHKIWFSSFKQTDSEVPMIIDDLTPKASPVSSASSPSAYSPKVSVTRKFSNEPCLPAVTECLGDQTQTEMMEVCDASNTAPIVVAYQKLLKPIGMDDISELTRDLSPVFNDWFELGIELGFNPGLLKPIEKTYTKMSRCMIEMLEAWINRGSNKTRAQIIEALRSSTVGHDALADELSRKYSTAA